MITKHSFHLVINSSLNFLVLSLDLHFVLMIFILLKTLSITIDNWEYFCLQGFHILRVALVLCSQDSFEAHLLTWH
uniref:Uncharacterized protein n=1 Tax=Lepeophtheirus salmonis TaxID=72036 RepID=A0A0K2T3B0_LEPSM